jgi:sugar/nucleoside kinase (ribokinase family)
MMRLRPGKEKEHSIAIIGHMAMDTIIHPGFTIESSPGGSAAALATAAVQFGIYPSIHSLIGHDFPKEWLRVLEALGVNISNIDFLEKEDSLKINYKYDDKGQAIIQCSDAVNRTISPETLPKTDGIHVCPMQPKDQVDLVKRYGKREVLSVNFSEYYTHEYEKMKLLDVMDWEALNIVFANENEGKAITEEENPEDMARKFHEAGVDVVVITRGEKGSLVFDGEDMHHVEARKVEVMDPTGCGDSYIGGFLGEFLGSRNLLKAAVAGTYMASLTAQKKGSWAALIADVGVRF